MRPDYAVQRRLALIERMDEMLARPDLSAESRAEAERIRAGVLSLLNPKPQESKPSSPKLPEEARDLENSTHPPQPLAKLSEAEINEALRLGTEYALESLNHNLAIRTKRIKAEAMSVPCTVNEDETGSGAVPDHLKPTNQQNEAPSNTEPRWSAARWWTIAGAGGLSVIPILAGPTWQERDAPDVKFGLLIFGPLIVALLVSFVFAFVDMLSSAKDRSEYAAHFAANPVKAILGLIFLFATLASFGLIVLAGMGLAPDSGNWFLLLPATMVIVHVIKDFV